MRTLAFLITIACARMACAASVQTVAVPPPAHADTESCAHLAVPPLADRTALRVALALNASPSNSLSAAVGVDADGDGRLSLREQALEFGWDGGAWFIRRRTPQGWERYEWPGPDGPQVFEAVLSFGQPGRRWLRLSVGGVPLVGGSFWVGGWLPPEAVEGGVVRVTARGSGVGGTAEVAATTEGTVLLLR